MAPTPSATTAAARAAGLAGLGTGEVTLRGILASQGGYVAMLLGSDEKTYIVRTGDKLSDGTIRTITGGRDGDSAADARSALAAEAARGAQDAPAHGWNQLETDVEAAMRRTRASRASHFTDERNMRLRYRYSTLLGLGVAIALGFMAPVGASGVRADAAKLKKIGSRVDGRSGVVTIEASDPVPYVASQPEPRTLVLELRDVVATGFVDQFTPDPRNPVAERAGRERPRRRRRRTWRACV